ncbi:hypothetical protein GY21_10900 [Cryobacterium roopkundense]|uniref:Uncharacterized protein n=1 Tax=Cryobacterium roopkundense TaxID=1001240 RepID=A0A099J567_9MICO|nr:hypothetical protein [Cryobacterium roopkundense]KGJ73539.1 hypothetical protein GY21_10900 [Cryobacterium roopkundense]MBB5641453.1 hypothetical protein [Cryobacterium roopkundense]
MVRSVVNDFLAPETRAALASVNALAGLLAVADSARAPASTPLDRLRAVRRLLHQLEADQVTLTSVREALAEGVGWDEIADASGLKPAAARWRWSGTDEEIAARLLAGRKRSARPSSVPTDLPGLSVAEAAARLGVSAQAVYLQVSRGKLSSQTVQLPDGRTYKRVFLSESDPPLS